MKAAIAILALSVLASCQDVQPKTNSIDDYTNTRGTLQVHIFCFQNVKYIRQNSAMAVYISPKTLTPEHCK